ncbi:MAG: hypothetical protein HPY74_19855 [Firmicutes bacterium]|nr:hypothetical protein [Bacillota bacterium]
MDKFDKKKFAELLEKAKGDRSINQYALHSGISAAHISRLLREMIDTPPNPDTIRKLTEKAYNRITYHELMVAAGHFDTKNIEIIETPSEKKVIRYGKDGIIEAIESWDSSLKLDGNNCTQMVKEVSTVHYQPERLIRIPVLGVIRAGEPILAEQNIIGYEYAEKDELNGGEYFYLKVKGDSMNRSRIQEGDLVLVRRQSDVNSGEIAVVMVNSEEATLKRVIKANDMLILQPDSYNIEYKPIVFSKKQIETNEIRILGKVIHAKIKF